MPVLRPLVYIRLLSAVAELYQAPKDKSFFSCTYTIGFNTVQTFANGNSFTKVDNEVMISIFSLWVSRA
ncbi:hypothetical protein DPX16_14670 [Anabarilius grahami]|uniref:Uncharacterized protein n=1 Tax=Anabarilius grahami TaxID=495550 RepID=A0A3N0XPQ2_ANAGA|nr:hypothetical protein DPX16_14670 [Anabarilius grahami]